MQKDVGGVIAPGHLYSLKEVRRRLRLGDVAWRDLRDAGLPVIRCGAGAYVLADDLLQVLAERKQAVPPKTDKAVQA